ncbi:DNA helicase B isoform X2 [Pristis pectinata]|uniref:DNA helicase B isoform X2 n=1 Tax=Pristis pectinata TaxID=685728 RepID=UPI00223DC034|nr:DNA helicase B isoform X2 [Pristis pectinata]
MAGRCSWNREFIVVEGYVLPRKGSAEDEKVKVEGESDTDENQEHEEDLQFFDLKDIINISLGATSINASSVARRFVKIKDLGSGDTYNVFGRFHFTSPWWKVTAKIFRHQKKWYLQWYPSYALRHLSGKEQSIVSLFLNKCGVHSDYIKEFIDYLSRHDLQFPEVLSILQQIAEEEKKKDENKNGFANCVIPYITKSVEGQHVLQALKFQRLMKYLPQLLPRYFLRTLKMSNDTLENLDQMICTEVWKLGFRSILSKELHLVGCEATLLAFEEADLLRTIPELQKHALIIYDKLKQICWKNGHTYVNIDELTGLRPSEFSVESAWESLKFLKESKIIVIEKKRVYLEPFYSYEQEIATCIKELVDKPPWCISMTVEEVLRNAFIQTQRECLPKGKEVDDTEHSEAVNLDPDQIRAATMMCENPVTIISGKGGSGKTTLVSLIFKAAVENMKVAENEELLQACEDLEQDQSAPECWDIPTTKVPNTGYIKKCEVSKATVLFTAPTGKAASLLRKKTGFAAYTLHQVIWNFNITQYPKEKRAVFDWKFSDVQVLIVDEGSLVSVKNLCTVLNLLMTYANLKKLIILGDIRQLPSIEPGNMLKDIYSSLYQVGWAIELPTNHRAESQLIVDNAAKIAEMGLRSVYIMLDYDAVMHISKEVEISIPTPDKKFILVSLESSPYVLREAINILLRRAPGLDNHVTSQFIAFRRDHKKYNDFQVGDKVCCTRNGYVVDFTKGLTSESEKERVRLCNGEIFFISEDKTVYTNTSCMRYLRLDDKENRQILVNFEEVRRECKLMHAWAKTIHTFQGSEADTVVYVVGTAGRQNWQHIYTAVTRGRQRVYVVTSEDQFTSAVTARSPQRNTRLRELLQEKLIKPRPASCFEGLQSQQQPSWVSTPAAPSSTLFHSSVSSTRVLPNFTSCVADEIKDITNTQSQKEDSYSEDLAFAQNYSWSPYSLELDVTEYSRTWERPTEAVDSLLQIGDGSMRDTLAGTTAEASTRSEKIEASWSPGSKRSDDTLAGEGSAPKYSKVLMESPLGCTKFKMMTLDNSSPQRHTKKLFKEESE